MESNETITNFLESWSKDQSQKNIIQMLTKMSDLIEKEYEIYMKMNPDPFDDRHPSRTKPACALGHSLKTLFKNESFMSKLVNDYLLNRDCKELQIAACRLTIAILPALDTSVVFDNTNSLLTRLFNLAREGDEPLQSYATGVLAAAMEVPDVATQNKEKNSELVPIMLKKLKTLMEERRKQNGDQQHNYHIANSQQSDNLESATKRRRISSPSNDCSNSSWAEMESYMIGSCKIYPLTNEISQRFIFQYLYTLGEYQDFLSFIFEHNVLDMILETIDLNRNHDVRLAFECLKYLSTLICHKKFALEFVNNDGIQALLRIYRQSLAASGVSQCLSCIAYHDDVMEKICMLPQNILSELVSYSLSLIERSHDTSRSNAMTFFSLAFSYKIILELFDSQDGLRKVLNEISMIDFFEESYTEDELLVKRQYAKHICFALRRYFETHLIVKAQSLIQSSSTVNSDNYVNYARLVNISYPSYKPINYDYDITMDHVEAMLHLVPLRFHWEPVDKLVKYGGVKLLLQYISMSLDWNFTGKAEAVRSALDILVVCSVLPKFQHFLTEYMNYDGENRFSGMRIILASAVGEFLNDPDCQRSALNVIINCVCGPINRASGLRISLGNANKRKQIRGGEDILNKMWNCVRLNNGIMLLINLLMTKTPITDADSIRTLSCKALCGLARSENVRQVMCKLPLFTNGQIQTLMKEPIFQDKRNEHLKFCKYCIELIESVTGSPVMDSLKTSLSNINKAEVITQTKIVFNEKELLKLIHNHLIEKGLDKTAQMLAEEADLSDSSSQNPIKNASKFSTPSKQYAPRMSRQISLTSTTSTLSQSPLIKSGSSNSTNSPSLNFSSSNINSQSKISIRINRANKNKIQNQNCLNNRKHSFHSNNLTTNKQTRNKQQITDTNSSNQSSIISLDSIVIEYLRKQHALCKNPVITCPPFDLFKPHRCPEPMNRNLAPLNITSRLIRRQYYPSYGGFYGAKFNRKFIYSRFRACRTMRCFEPTTFLTVAFAYNTNQLLVGTDTGELHVFNHQTGDIENSYTPYDSSLTHLEPSKDNLLLLTTTYWERPNSILWSIADNAFDEKMSFPDDHHVEFGKTCQDKVLGTQDHTANLYDLNVSTIIRTFVDESFSNRYAKNMATFHPNDYLILNDGVLWDIRTQGPLHKFDKLNETINGVFHPNGQVVISSSEIWDLKTYKLLKTVSALSQSHIKFNSKGDVIYAINEEENKNEQIDDRVTYSSSFRTFDGYDYSNITTIDVKRSIHAMAVDPTDRWILLVEQTRDYGTYYSQENNVVRMYEVGRSREEDDEERLEDDENEESEDDDEEDEEDERMDDSSFELEIRTDSDDEDDHDDDDDDDHDEDSINNTDIEIDDSGSSDSEFYIYQLSH